MPVSKIMLPTYRPAPKRCLALAAILGFFLLAYGRQATAADKILPNPVEAQSLEAVTPALAGMTMTSSRQLLLLPENKPGLLVSLAFNGDGANRAKAFGPLLAQKRQAIGGAKGSANLVGIDAAQGRVLLLDGEALVMIQLALPDYKEIVRRTLPWDLVKPPADRGGEPTRPEVQQLRALFKKRWLETTGHKVSGLALMPPAWHHDQQRHYLLASRVAGFPLLEMACGDEADPTVCTLSRQCYLQGADGIDPDGVAGIAISAARHLFLLADQKRQRLVSFKFDSCYHSVKQDEYQLPAQLKRLTNAYIDSDDRLWVTTAAADDYLNASLYYWPKAAW